MSRKGNCWDNAPMESFFGHMKDEINLKQLKTLDEVKKEISKYMNYNNNNNNNNYTFFYLSLTKGTDYTGLLLFGI